MNFKFSYFLKLYSPQKLGYLSAQDLYQKYLVIVPLHHISLAIQHRFQLFSNPYSKDVNSELTPIHGGANAPFIYFTFGVQYVFSTSVLRHHFSQHAVYTSFVYPSRFAVHDFPFLVLIRSNVMATLCPFCHSHKVERPCIAKKTGATIGFIAGLSAGLVGAASGAEIGLPIGCEIGTLLGPAGTVVGGVAGAIIGGLVGGLSGCMAGVKLGEAIDEHILHPYFCSDCLRHFNEPFDPPMPHFYDPFIPD